MDEREAALDELKEEYVGWKSLSWDVHEGVSGAYMLESYDDRV
jgi:hypothetical protein